MGKVPLPLNASTKRKHKTQAQNASAKRYHKTQALMGATRPASGIKAKAHTPNKSLQTARIIHPSVSLYLKNPDAGRVAPISACVWCLRLVIAFSGSVWCLSKCCELF